MRSEERGFIEALRSDPESDAIQLVYADWLEEQGDMNRAEFLRLSVQLTRLSEEFERERDRYHSPLVEPIARTRIRLRELCRNIPPAWLAQIHRGKVNICDFKSVEIHACPSHWEQLDDTNDPLVRHCDVCKEKVLLVTSWAFGQSRRCALFPFV